MSILVASHLTGPKHVSSFLTAEISGEEEQCFYIESEAVRGTSWSQRLRNRKSWQDRPRHIYGMEGKEVSVFNAVWVQLPAPPTSFSLSCMIAHAKELTLLSRKMSNVSPRLCCVLDILLKINFSFDSTPLLHDDVVEFRK